MKSQLEQSSDNLSRRSEAEAEIWRQIAPLLDTAMEKLGQKDHDALVLRFFEGRNFKEVGAVLGASEDAAKMRVSRALEKLRNFFTKRGVSSTTAVLAGSISTHSIQVAPVGLAKSISIVAAAKGSVVAASTVTLVKGTMKTMTWLKIKFVSGTCLGILVIGGLSVAVLSEDAVPSRSGEIVEKVQGQYASLSSYSASGTTVSTLMGKTFTCKFTIKLARPDLYRIEFERYSDSTTNTGTIWNSGDGNFMFSHRETSSYLQYASPEAALMAATGMTRGSCEIIPMIFLEKTLERIR